MCFPKLFWKDSEISGLEFKKGLLHDQDRSDGTKARKTPGFPDKVIGR